MLRGETNHPASADILAVGFGTAAAMWAAGYFARLFGPAVPAPLLFAVLLVLPLAGGFLAGHYAARGLRAGILGGLLSGLINLLIIGSIVGGNTPNAIRAGALLWIPGTLVVCTGLATVGALLGRTVLRWSQRPEGQPRRAQRPDATAGTPPEPYWPGVFAAVAVLATLLLLAAGGLVTGFDEGLAVVDWPNTEGYNMFLYPLARMTGGILLEHSHRLLGSLVGLTVLVLAVHTQLTEDRHRVRWMAWSALLLVIVQGVLGGLRVTGRPTLSTNPADTSPSVVLAIVHGVVGQLVFATLVGLATLRSGAWRSTGPPVPALGARTERHLGAALIALLIVQLVLGALVRHFTWALQSLRYGLPVDPARLAAIGEHMLIVHITFAVLVLLLATAVGLRAWGLYPHVPRLAWLGSRLLVLTGVQLGLGLLALVAAGNDAIMRRPTPLDVALTTAHQIVGAALLAWAVLLTFWGMRLLAPGQAEAGAS